MSTYIVVVDDEPVAEMFRQHFRREYDQAVSS